MATQDETQPAKQGTPEQTKITAKTIEERYALGLRATMFERREFWINDAMLRGRQWVYWNKQTSRVDDINRTKGRVQATIDRLSPSSRTVAAMYLQRPLTFEDRPSAPDQDTIQKAKTAQAVIRQHQVSHRWERLDEDLFWAMWKGGYAAICVDWDSDKGDYVDDGLYTGDTCESVLTAAEFVVEPGAREAETARWWIKAVVLPPETVQAMYSLEELPPSNAQSSMSPYNSRTVTTEADAMNREDGTLVITYYERPNLLNSAGSVAIVVDGKIVESKTWPFRFKDRLNLVVGRETPLSSTWKAEAILSKATKVQVFMNAAWSNFLEHLKNVGQPRLMLPASQLDLEGALEDNSAKPLKYLDGPGMAQPGYLTPPQLPAWIVNSMDMLEKQMDDILGVHAISRGQAPANIESGDGLRVLAEQDATPLGRLTQERARVWTDVAHIVLETLADNVQDQRKAVIQTSNEPPMSVPWTGAEIGAETRVLVPTDAIRPKSQAAQWMLAKEMMQMRPDWFHGPAEFLAVAEVSDADDILWVTDVQTAKARRVAHFAAEGIYIKPERRDTHEIFIREITNFMQTPRFEQLEPDNQKLLQLLADGHQRMGEEQMGEQQAKGMMSPALAAVPNAAGAPTLGGPPPGPAGPPEMGGAPETPGMPGPQQPPPVGG